MVWRAWDTVLQWRKLLRSGITNRGKKNSGTINYDVRWSLWAVRGSQASREVEDGHGMRGSSLKIELMKKVKGS